MTRDEYMEHAADNDGLCLACGEWAFGGCEPDMTDGECESCGALSVHGAEECLMIGEIEID